MWYGENPSNCRQLVLQRWWMISRVEDHVGTPAARAQVSSTLLGTRSPHAKSPVSDGSATAWEKIGQVGGERGVTKVSCRAHRQCQKGLRTCSTVAPSTRAG